MLKSMIDRIIDLQRPETVTIDNKTYRIDGYKPVLDPYPDCLGINNLTGIVDFIGQAPETWDKGFFVHVKDFDDVTLYQGKTGNFNQRVAIIHSQSRPCGFLFGRKMSVEDFIIALHGQFIPNEDRNYLLDLVSSIRMDNSMALEDNGITQTVTAKKGASSLVTKATLKNPLELKPFRTFNEVDQPASQFIFRLSKDGECSLHECDGAAWKQEAIQNIKGFFVDNMPAVPVIA